MIASRGNPTYVGDSTKGRPRYGEAGECSRPFLVDGGRPPVVRHSRWGVTRRDGTQDADGIVLPQHVAVRCPSQGCSESIQSERARDCVVADPRRRPRDMGRRLNLPLDDEATDDRLPIEEHSIE